MRAILPLALLACYYPFNAEAVLPLPTYPDCGAYDDLTQCPPDLTHQDGSWKGSTWEYVSFLPPDMKVPVRPSEEFIGSGNGADVGWRYSTGRFDVTVAVLDSGILWHSWELPNKILLNERELPPPNISGTLCSNRDCNSDGIFNIRDYANDSRVKIDAGVDPADGMLDPSDLIYTFSDGVDDDQNGFIDDIAGWDFLWNNNDPFASNGFDHGTGVLQDIGAEGGEADSGIGYCPNCSLLPVRTGDSFIAASDRLAQGILYAVERGAKVVAMASGTTDYTQGLQDALEYAWAHGTLVVSAIGDEMSYHHLYPGAADYLMAVHSIRFWPPTEYDLANSFIAFNGCNNYGSHLTVVAGTTSCATGATAITAGAAGLIFSYGLEQGLELHPDEVRGLLVNSATDISVPGSGTDRSPWFPSRDGWDVMFGYGRINIGEALEGFRIPPQVHLQSPKWYEYIDAAATSTIEIEGHVAAPLFPPVEWRLEWAPGGDAADADFEDLMQDSDPVGADGRLFSWPIVSIPRDRLDPAVPLEQVMSEDDMMTRFAKVNAHAITLRLSATDAIGRTAEMRKTFFLHDDPDLLPGFPIQLGAGGESSPWLVDLDQDGVQDILIGTASGMLHAIDGASANNLPGWPIEMPYNALTDPAAVNSHASAIPYASGEVELLREGVVATLNAGDLDNNGSMEVVASTMDGLVYVFSAEGELAPGFPVSRDPVSEADTSEYLWYDPGMISSPLLVDLDRNGDLEIVQAAMDQKVYAWKYNGQRLPSFPVLLESQGSEDNIRGRVISSPVAADLNHDQIPDIILGTNEYDPELYLPGYAYAISGRGNEEITGPILRGWPVAVPGLLNGLVPFIAEGVTMSPVIADVDSDGEVEIALSGTCSCPHLYEADGQRSTQYHCVSNFWNEPATDEGLGLTYVSNPQFGDVDGDGDLEIAAAMSGLSYVLSLAASTWIDNQDHMIGLWDAQTGEGVPGWPVVIEDLATFMRPAITDLDGDDLAEVIVGSGGYTLHAFDLNGTDIPGWPKLTGGFVLTAIATGDITGDGLTEVVAVTHEGYLFAWTTSGQAEHLAPATRVHTPIRSSSHPPAKTLALVPARSAPAASFHAPTAPAPTRLGASRQ